MQFLSDVYLPCPECGGKRYKASTLEVKLRLSDDQEYSIADVLDMTAKEAVGLFFEHPAITSGLQQLCSVGLGYLKLGQPLTTLSGGERQRLKLAGTLAEGLSVSRRGPGKLFVFDEPTTGLHFDDTATLVRVLDGLVCLGHSVLVIEHNLDVLNTADWIIELGPDGGQQGGDVVFEGTPMTSPQRPTPSRAGRSRTGATSLMDERLPEKASSTSRRCSAQRPRTMLESLFKAHANTTSKTCRFRFPETSSPS